VDKHVDTCALPGDVATVKEICTDLRRGRKAYCPRASHWPHFAGTFARLRACPFWCVRCVAPQRWHTRRRPQAEALQVREDARPSGTVAFPQRNSYLLWPPEIRNEV